MAVKFIIDSASDVLPGECKKLDVVHVPLTVRFGDKEFADAVDLSHKKFYKMLTSGKEEHPTTSQVTPAAWAEAMEEVTKDGDTAVVITLSSKLSGTYQSACIAAEDFEGKVFVVDSMTATIGERLLLEYGISLAREGLDAATIAADLLEKSGGGEAEELRRAAPPMMVTPRDIDHAVRQLGKVAGYAINRALQDMDISEMTALLT